METKQFIPYILLGISAVVLIYYLHKKWNNIAAFVRDVKGEMKKVTWSTRKELISATCIVIISVFLLTLFVGIIDFIISRAISLAIR